MEYVVLNPTELPNAGGARVYEGRCHDGTNISLLLVDLPPGRRATSHRHPYKEIFIVHEGQAKFTIGTASIDIAAGSIVIVAAGIPHKFVELRGRETRADRHSSEVRIRD